MKSVNVSLDSIDKIRSFVSIITMFDGEYDLVSNRYVVDAKSIMGIFSLDLAQPLRLDIHDAAQYDNVVEKLGEFIV